MMNKENLKKIIQEIKNSRKSNLKLFIMTKGGEVKKLKISIDVSNSLLLLFLDHLIDEFIKTSVDYKIEPIEKLNDEMANVYYYFTSTNIYEKLSIFQSFQETEDFFELDDLSFKDIETFFISISSEENKILLYKKNYPINLLRQGKVLHLFNANQNIDLFKKDILRIDKSFQFLAYDGNVLIANLKMLEQQLGYSDVIIKNANEILQIIASLDLLTDMAKLEEMTLTARIAKKVNKIKNSKVIDILKDDVSKVQEFIDKIAELKTSLKFNKDGKLEVKSQVAVEKFLKLLDDAYLKSELTDEWYDSFSKDVLQSKV